MPRNASQLVDAYEKVYERADREGRDLTPSERSEVADLVEAASQQ